MVEKSTAIFNSRIDVRSKVVKLGWNRVYHLQDEQLRHGRICSEGATLLGF
jgi:hypothetical protein